MVRNPMAIGAGATLAAAALFESLRLLGFTVIFIVIIHLLVVFYEEPVVKQTFGEACAAYCDSVRRWWPGLPTFLGSELHGSREHD